MRKLYRSIPGRLIGLYLAYEAVLRLFAPEPVEGWTVVIVAGVALAVDAALHEVDGAALSSPAARRQWNELAAAMQHAVADRGRFVTIDAVMERGRMSETLSRYVAGFERRRAGSTG